MEIYLNRGGNSGIRKYDIGEGYIIIEFRDGGFCKYTNHSAGADVILEMHNLAKKGHGLNSYIMSGSTKPVPDSKWR